NAALARCGKRQCTEHSDGRLYSTNYRRKGTHLLCPLSLATGSLLSRSSTIPTGVTPTMLGLFTNCCASWGCGRQNPSGRSPVHPARGTQVPHCRIINILASYEISGTKGSNSPCTGCGMETRIETAYGGAS